MDSKLDSIFRTRFHPAEKSDTWMGIRRHDPDDGRHKKDREEKEDNPEFGEDNTTLSVTALHGFLMSLLPQDGAPQTAPETPDSSAHAPAPGYRAATSAYQTAAASGRGPSVSMTDTPPPSAAAPLVTLSEDELCTVRQLLRDVEKLARYGGQTITLRPAATFLESLAMGVEDALDTTHP